MQLEKSRNKNLYHWQRNLHSTLLGRSFVGKLVIGQFLVHCEQNYHQIAQLMTRIWWQNLEVHDHTHPSLMQCWLCQKPHAGFNCPSRDWEDTGRICYSYWYKCIWHIALVQSQHAMMFHLYLTSLTSIWSMDSIALRIYTATTRILNLYKSLWILVINLQNTSTNVLTYRWLWSPHVWYTVP